MKRFVILLFLLTTFLTVSLSSAFADPIEAYVAVTQNKNAPRTYVNLRTAPSMQSFAAGGFFDGTPVVVLDGAISADGDAYEKVLIGYLEDYYIADGRTDYFLQGYIQAKFLSPWRVFNRIPQYSMPGGHMMSSFGYYPDGSTDADAFSVSVWGFMMLPIWYAADGDGKKDDQPPDGRWYVEYKWNQMHDQHGYWDAMQPGALN